MFSFLTVSKGTFNESLTSNNETATITSTQNSPISFGVGAAYFYRPRNTFSGSIYFSRLTGSVAEDTGAELDIQTEIGTNIYYNYSFPSYTLSLYSGFDYEQFSTYNTDEILEGSTTYKVRKHNIGFVTAGVGKSFSVATHKFLFKASISKSITSSSSELPATTNNGSDTYSGIKYILYLNYKASSNFLVHAIYKQHLLDGPTDLSILRIGVGVGYKFF